MRYLYSAAYFALFPLILLRMLLRSLRAPAYRDRLGERCGRLASELDPQVPVIWVHAVSVGEVQAATPLIEGLLAAYPQYRIVVTTTTPTGSARVQALFGSRVFHVYCPWDLPWTVQRFLRCVRPRLLLIIETELWPNLLHYTAAGGCGVMLVNARLSERSARGYARVPRLSRQMLQCLDLVACQSAADASRFQSLGLPGARLQVSGNLKFDQEFDTDQRQRAAQLRRDYGAGRRPILLAASTHATEELIILEAFAEIRSSFPDCLLVLAPRHPERFAEVHRLALEQDWRVVRQSSRTCPAPDDDVVLCDTMGELALLFSVAEVAVIGGSLVERGGHNPLEAAVWGVPIVVGTHTYNFVAVCELLLAAGALEVVSSPAELVDCLRKLFADPAARRSMGQAGRRTAEANQGATSRVLQLVERQLASA